VLHSVDTYAIDAVIPDECLDPAVKSGDDFIFLRVHVDQLELVIPEPTLLDLRLVVEVRDQAPRMEIRFLVEGIEGGEGGRGIFRGKVVYHDVDHQVHTSLMQSISESLQVIAGAKMRVEGIEVLWPVPRTGTISNLSSSPALVNRWLENQPVICLSICTCSVKIRNDRRNPDRVESHVLDVIQLIYDASVGTTTILAVFRVASRSRPFRCKPVRDQLVTSWLVLRRGDNECD
jgi:hypothetical protein